MAQIAIRFTVQLGAITLPKSTTPSRIQENGELSFVIDDDYMKALSALDGLFYRD